MSTGIQGLSTLENVLHDMRHSLLSQSNTGISRANALKLAFAGIIKLLLYFPCCIAMDLTFLCEKTMKLLENILQLWKTTSYSD